MTKLAAVQQMEVKEIKMFNVILEKNGETVIFQ